MENEQFWNKVAVKYAARPIPNEAIYQEKLTLTKLVLQEDMTALEIGCGTGSTALINGQYVKHYHATDISEAMIDIAQAKLTDSGASNIHFKVESVATSLGIEAKYDVILAHSLLHLLEAPDETIKSVYASLKPGGFFISGTVCMGDNLAWFRFIVPVGRLLGLMPGLTIFKKQDLVNWHNQTGFRIDTKWTPVESQHTCFIIAQKPD